MSNASVARTGETRPRREVDFFAAGAARSGDEDEAANVGRFAEHLFGPCGDGGEMVGGEMCFERFGVGRTDRFRTLTLGSLADGILDAALLLVYEGRFRPENMKVQGWVDRQQGKVDRSLALLETAPPAWKVSPDYGHLTMAVALGYLDFRHGGKWRAGHPKLVKWLDEFAAAVPAFEATRPVA